MTSLVAESLHGLFDGAAAAHPGRVWRDQFREATLASLAAESTAAAVALAAAGAGPHARVALLSENRLDVAVTVVASSRLRASTAVLPPDAPAERLAKLLAELEPAAVVASEACSARARAAGVDPLPLETLAAATPAHAGPPPDVGAVDGSDPVLLLYTSGSTSLPKAVVCPQSSVTFATSAIGERLRYRADDRIYCALALSFDYGLYQTFLAAAAGAELVVRPPGGIDDLATICDLACTVVPVLPSMARRIVLQAGRSGRRGSSVRLLTNTGDVLGRRERAELREIFPGTAIVLMFGQTECKRIAVSDPDDDLRFPGSCGTALPGTELEVVGEDGSPVAPGTAGELVVRGPHLMAGYWADPVGTARRFGADAGGRRLLRTGDVVHLDEGGRVYFHGRRDGELKIRGIRTSATEIEEGAATVPGVRAAAVVPPRGLVPATLVVEGDATPAAVRRDLAARIGTARVPPAAVVVEALPLNDRGKRDPAGLRAIAEHDRLRRLVQELGTPCYVYDLDEMGAAAARIAAGLPRPHALYYSLKANPNPAVVGAMLDAGCRAEVSSPSELAVVLGELAGPDPDRVLYTGPGKAGALAAAIAAGCRWFSVESTTELAALEAAAGESGVEVSAVIRLNVAAPPTGARLPISGGASKFGVDVEDALALAATAPASPSVTVAGLQFFQGGNVAPAALGALLVDEVRIAAAFRDRVDVRLLDLGGGFAAPYGRPGSADAPPPVQPIEAVLDECFAGWRGGRPLVAFESGRALVGSGGVLACRVTDVKHSGGRRFVLVDSGIHHLGGMFGLRRLVRPELQVLDALQRPPAGRATVAGPLCTPLDTWGEQDLPDVAVGDLLLVRGVGAYGLSASLLGFVSQDPALEVAARQGEIVSARRVGVVGEEVRRPVVG